MTRPHSEQLASVITEGSFTRELVCDVYYGLTRTLVNVPVESWSFTGDYDANIKTAANVTIVYQGDFADSVTPKDFTDALAPFGQEVRLFMVVSAGAFTERIAMGIYRIDDVPSANDTNMLFQERLITVGSVVELTLLDRFSAVDAALFRSLDQPLSLGSAWTEIARVSRLQVTRTVPDVPIPRSVVYSRNRLETVQQLATLLGGRAIMRADGTLGVVPNAIGEPTITLRIGDDNGTIIKTGNYLSAEGLHNVVIGDFETEDGQPIHVEAAITSGPLSTTGPLGERVTEYPDDQTEFIVTHTAAQTAVDNHLAKVSKLGPAQIPVELIPDPRIEIGDIVSLERLDTTVVGRVVAYSLDRTGPMGITVRI